MAETIHKGWLKTREEEKFAPKTFIDNVYDSTGQQYDKVIKDHINSVAQTIKIDGIDTSVEDTFYICDDSGNVIARIDKEGVHSIDFTISNSSVKEALAELTQSYELVSKDVEEIQESLQNLDTSDSNTFYICDGSGNIIFRVDAEGAYSTNFATKNGDLNNALSRLAILEGRLTWMDESDDSTFIIVDSSGNKAFEISSTTNGAKAYDFVLPEAITVAETEVSTLREAIAVLGDVEADLTALEGVAAKNSDLEELEGTVNGLTSTVNGLTQTLTALDDVLDWDADDNFTIVDNSGNKIATFDASGATSINFIIGTTGWNKKYDNLVDVIEALIDLENEYTSTIGDPNSPAEGTILYRLAQLESWKSTASSQITQLQEADTALSGRIDVLEQFKNDIDETYATDEDVNALAGRVSELEAEDILINADIEDLQAKDGSLQNQITTLSTSIQENLGLNEEDNAFVIVDKSNNKILEVDSTGTISTDFIVSPRYYIDADGNSKLLDERTPSSLIGTIDKLNSLDTEVGAKSDKSGIKADNVWDALAEEKDRAEDVESVLRQDVDKKVPKTRKINNQELTSDITINKVAEAEKATKDAKNNIIDETYLKVTAAFTQDAADERYYSKSAGESLANTVSQHTITIGTIDDGTDKATLWGTINKETARAIAAEQQLSGRIDVIIDNPETADTIDSIKEFTQYIEDHGDIAQGFSKDIEDLKAKDGSLQNQITTLGGEVDDIQAVIDVTVGDTALTVVDKNNFKIMEVDNTGVASVDFIVSPVYDASGTATERTPNSLVSAIDKLNSLDTEIGNKSSESGIEATTIWAALAEEKKRAINAESGLSQDINSKVPNTRTINGSPLSADITIDSVENATNAKIAEKATADANGKDIASTYLTINAAQGAYYSKSAGESLANTVSEHTTKLNTIDEGANKTIVDEVLSDSSTNPVQNKAVKAAIDTKLAKTYTADQKGKVLIIDNDGNAVPGDGFTKATADGLYAAKAIESTVSGHTQAIDALRVFKNIKVGDTTISADTGVEDTLTLIAGDGITLTPNAVNDSITINGTTQYTLPIASTDTLGGIKTSAAEKNISAASYVFLNTLVEEDSEQLLVALPKPQQQNNVVSLPGMDWEFTIPESGISNGFTTVSTLKKDTTTGEIEASIVATGEDGFKLKPGNNITLSANATDKTITINASSTIEGSAGSADKLTNEIAINLTGDVIGSASTDFSGDVTIDTEIVNHHQAKNIVGASSTATTNGAADNTKVYLNLVENGQVRSSHNIKGTGATTVTSDINGHIIIDSTDKNVTKVDYHYTPEANVVYEINADALSATEATWGTTSLVTGVNVSRDAAGHVTNVTVDSIKMPTEPDTHLVGTNIVGASATANANASVSSDTNAIYLNHIENGQATSSIKIQGGGATKVSSGTDGTITISSTIEGAVDEAASADWATKAGILASAKNEDGYSEGSINKPIYFKDGVPKEISYEINANVPSDAVFTDTHLKSENVVGASATAILNGVAANGSVYLNHVEDDDEVTSSHKISGTGGTTVTSDENGNIIIHSATNGTATSAEYATKAGKLVDPTDTNTNIDVGDTNEPVYFKNGVPTKIGYQINKTVPSDAVFTDIATTLAGHYDPEADNASTLSKDASGSSAAAWGNTSLVTGVNIYRDAKGHITDVTLDAVKMPAKPTFEIDNVDTDDNLSGQVVPGGDITWDNGVGHVKDNSHAHTIANITGLSDKIDPISMDDTSTFKIVDNSGNILAEFNAAEGLVVPKIKVQNVAGNAEWVPAYLAADTSIELEII